MKRTPVLLLISMMSLILVGPFLIPIPPLEGLSPPEAFAEPDSQFIRLRGVRIHLKNKGSGLPALILLHGFGASIFTWREVLAPLAAQKQVIAFDRPAFGLSERPLHWQGENPYTPEFQVELVLALMDYYQLEQAVLVGNSAGGTIAVLTALEHPERVAALVLVDAAIYAGGSPIWFSWLARTPQMQHLGPLIARNIQNWGMDFARSAWHDPSKITPEIWEGYTLPLKVENWDRALWLFTSSSRHLKLEERLHEILAPTLVISGDDDRIVPLEDSQRLASELPNAQLVVIPNCGHIPQEECPDAFLAAINAFLDQLDSSSK